VDTRVEVLDFRLHSVEGTGSGNAIDDNLVPDFILPKAGCCRYGCSHGFLNGRAVGFEDREGRVFSLVISLMLWFVVNSMVAIRGFLIAELMAL